MKFHEHIIRVAVPEAGGPSRSEVWKGIVEFARHPERFYEEIAQSEVFDEHSRDAGVCEFSRRVRFHANNLAFEERVTLDEVKGVCRSFFAGDASRPASDFTMQLEEPEPGSLFVRFIYNEMPGTQALPAQHAAILAALRKQAYEAKDRQVMEGILQHASGMPRS